MHLLVLTDQLPDAESVDASERRQAQLLAALAQSPAVTPTVLSRPPRQDGWVGAFDHAAMDFVTDSPDWAAWLESHAFQFSAVLLEGLPLAERLLPTLRRAQPEAKLILRIDAAPSWSVEAWGAADARPLEADGLETVASSMRSLEMETLRSMDLAVCTTSAAAARLAEMHGLRALIFGGRSDWLAAGDGFEARSGLVCVTNFSREPGWPDEDGLRWFLRGVRPRLDVLGTLPLSVCGEDVVPWMRRIEGPTIEIVERDRARAACTAARVLVAPRRYGSVRSLVLDDAVAAALPFVASPAAIGDLELGDIETYVVAHDEAEFAHKARALATSGELWSRVREGLLAAVRVPDPGMSDDQFTAHLLGAIGLSPGETITATRTRNGVVTRPAGGTLADYQPAVGAFHTQVLPPSSDELDRDATLRVMQSISLDDRYALWRRVHEPTATALDAMAEAAASLQYHPIVSIVSPVYNTPREVLGATIESLLHQAYPYWELCLVDDASTRQETHAVLEHFRDSDPRIRLEPLPKNMGIVGASNVALDMAQGEYVGFLDHDDLLKPDALYWVARLLNQEPTLDFIYTDEDKIDEDGRLCDPFFKPDWSPDLLLSVNYIAHFTVIRRSLVSEVGGFRDGYDGSQDFDLFLRVTEHTKRIAHIPRPLYSWRKSPASTASDVAAKPYADSAGKRALRDALERRGLEAAVSSGAASTFYQVRYAAQSNPRVCVIIPTRDRVDLVEACVNSLTEHTDYKNYDVMIVDNESTDEATLDYLGAFEGRVLRYPHRFNYARMMNLAALEADADYLLMLNNDARVRTPEWLELLLEHAQRPEVGIVGARLFFPDGRPQHEGIVLGVGGVAYNLDASGYFALGESIRDCAGVTGACLMTRHDVFWEVGGFDERLRVAYNDVDFCLRVGERGYRILYTPYVELVHPESTSRKSLHPEEDEAFFQQRWGPARSIRDPFHNPNLDLLNPLILRV